MTRTAIGRRLAVIGAAAAVAAFAGCGEDEGEDAQSVPDAQQQLDEGEQELEEGQDQIDDAQRQAEDAIDQAQDALEDPEGEAREQLEQELQEQLQGGGD